MGIADISLIDSLRPVPYGAGLRSLRVQLIICEEFFNVISTLCFEILIPHGAIQ
jgi:hypothetical protein